MTTTVEQGRPLREMTLAVLVALCALLAACGGAADPAAGDVAAEATTAAPAGGGRPADSYQLRAGLPDRQAATCKLFARYRYAFGTDQLRRADRLMTELAADPGDLPPQLRRAVEMLFIEYHAVPDDPAAHTVTPGYLGEYQPHGVPDDPARPRGVTPGYMRQRDFLSELCLDPATY